MTRIKSRIAEDGESLNPEAITVLDPACGSGHILVVAYDVLKAIYLERGYQPRAIPRLILEKNLYGLDIDERAAQLSSFALCMKGRADDRQLFSKPPILNVLPIADTEGLRLDNLATDLVPLGVPFAHLSALLEVFKPAKTRGSLIQIPEELRTALPSIAVTLEAAGAAMATPEAQPQRAKVALLVRQASILSMKVDNVIANPPYMNRKYLNHLDAFLKTQYTATQIDLYAAFIIRSTVFAKATGFVSMIAMDSWMFGRTSRRRELP